MSQAAPNGSPDRPARPVRRAVVEAVEQLTPRMVRIVVGGDDLSDFGAGEFTDHYVKLQLPPPGADYGSDFDPDTVRATRPRELWPKTRTYSVRAWDGRRKQLTLDFVVHGDVGVAGPWAAAAQPGDTLLLTGPGGAYAPSPQADWHLLVGDASVLPAIAASLPRIPDDSPTWVVAEVDGPAEELDLPATRADLRMTWVHRRRGAGEEPGLLLDAVSSLELPAGVGHAFVHGEASAVRAIRRHLLVDRALDAAMLSASGYWKLRRTEEGWRQDKAEWKRLAEDDISAAPG
jgi:NADPH-dependent ferric siderophore reductase